jgi:hypothetical protein
MSHYRGAAHIVLVLQLSSSDFSLVMNHFHQFHVDLVHTENVLSLLFQSPSEIPDQSVRLNLSIKGFLAVMSARAFHVQGMRCLFFIQSGI